MIQKHGFDHIMCGPCWADKYHSQLPHYETFRDAQPCCFCNRLTREGTTYWTPHFPPRCPERR